MTADLHIEYRPLRYVRGWPTPSAKPWLVYVAGRFVAAFSTEQKAFSFAATKEPGQ